MPLSIIVKWQKSASIVNFRGKKKKRNKRTDYKYTVSVRISCQNDMKSHKKGTQPDDLQLKRVGVLHVYD